MDLTVRAVRDDLIMVTTHCPSRPYLELQIPGNIAKVTSITIRLTSRDQGFCDEEGRIGQPGFTWYELNVERPSGRNRIPRECIYQNPAGIPEWKETVIESSDGTSGTLQLLVDGLQPLDIVQLCPRVNFIGWVNYLGKAEVKIQYTTLLAPLESALLSRPRYNKLDSNGTAIRLLDLLPGHGAETIRAKLISVNFSDGNRPSFEALSYCWGQPFYSRSDHISNDSAQIQCLDDDGSLHRVHISPSLRDALLHLRDSSNSRILWVDQLCINQADKSELARQVSMMGRIYSGAERVVVWLGAGDAETERSIDTVNRLLPQYREPTKEALRDGSLEVGLPGVSHDDLPIKEINRFLTLPWFWRVWVVQEVWRARQRAFMYGRRTLHWETIWKANVWSKYGSFEVPGTQHTNLPLFWTSFAGLNVSNSANMDMAKTSWMSIQETLLMLVIQGLDLKASDLRDHIFGLLGLLQVAQPTEEGPDRLIYPDYHKSVSEVLIDFTIWVILCTKSLRILSAIQAVRGRTWQTLGCTGPERVPPHDQPPFDHASWAMWYSGMRKWENQSLRGSRDYQVTGGSVTDMSLIAWENSERGKLQLQGHRLGKIQSIEPYLLRFGHVNTDMFSTFNLVFDASGARRIYSTPVTEAFNGYKRGWDDPLQHWAAHGHRHGDRLHIPAALPCLDNCVFELDDGSKGLCSVGTKPGDIVVILYGGDVPYVLREALTESQYMFVGECYLDGRMHKNLLAPFEEAEIPREGFVLV